MLFRSLAICFYHGIFEMVKLKIKEKKILGKLPFVFLVLGLFMMSPLKELNQIANHPYPPAYENFFAIAKILDAQAPENSVVCSRKPELFYFFCDRYSVRYLYSSDERKVIADLLEKNIDYVILEQLGYSSTYRYLYPAIQKHADLFKPVIHLQNPDTYLLTFDKDKAKNLLAIPGSE